MKRFAVIAICFLSGPFALSQDKAKDGFIVPLDLDDVKLDTAGRFKKEGVAKFAIAVTKAAHPTAKKPAVLKFSQSMVDNVVRLKMEIEYYGAASANRYAADSLIQFQLPKNAKDPLEVKSIDFVDNNNSIKPNTKNLERLRAELNSRYRIEAAK